MREGKFMKVSTLLAERFETVEALAVIDILRRAKIEVDTVSFSGERNVTSAQGVTVVADALIEDYDFSDTDVLFLPGGPGHKNYKASSQVLDLITSFARSGKRVASICAAPSIPGELGLLEGKKAVCFPGFDDSLKGAQVLHAPVRVITDGNMTTSRGMGTSIDLGLELVSLLLGEDKAHEIAVSIQYIDE